MGVFRTIKSELTPFYAFTGFLIAELIKPKDPIKALDKMLNALFRKENPVNFSQEGPAYGTKI